MQVQSTQAVSTPTSVMLADATWTLESPMPWSSSESCDTWLEMQRQDRSLEGRGSLHSSASGTLPEDKQDTPRYCFPMPVALHCSVALSVTSAGGKEKHGDQLPMVQPHSGGMRSTGHGSSILGMSPEQSSGSRAIETLSESAHQTWR